MATKGPESLEQLVRDGASEFNFGALISPPSDSELSPPSDSMQDRFDSYLGQPVLVPHRPDEAIVLRPSRSGPGRSTLAITALGIAAIGGWFLYLRQPSVVTQSPTVPATTPVVEEPKAQEKKAGLPRPDLTPGERGTVAIADLPVPDDVRRHVFTSYGIDPDDPLNVPVRLIPAALGGTNGPKNVFPVTPWFAELKSRLDSFLVNQVRTGETTPEQAVQALTSNWIRACHRNYIRNYGQKDSEKARKTEDQLRWSR